MDQHLDSSLKNIDEHVERVHRRRMLKTAMASYNDRAISMEVVLRQMSETGVKLELKENSVLPEHFHLYVELDGVDVDCEVVWRRGLEVGAKFVSEVQSKAPLRSQVVVSTRVGEN
jgi:hypothetical protein